MFITVSNKVIGIDLGTTNSCLAIVEGDDFKIIENSAGSRTTPSVVSIINGVREVGIMAKQQGAINPKNVFFATKRLIGKKISELSSSFINIFPFKIVDNGENVPVIEYSDEGKTHQISAVEVATHILTEIKKTADNYTKEDVRKAIITVPAYFDDSQRVATQTAGKLAGLEVLRIINEPTAAALAYGLGKNNKNENVLIYDLGGGTFDVTALVIDNGVFEIKATGGDTSLGGEDFDKVLFDLFINNYFKVKFPNISLDIFSKKRLIEALEEAKKALSFKESFEIVKPFFIHDSKGKPINLKYTITRRDFERASANLIKKTIKTIKDVIKDSGINKEKFHQVVLVGGITRIPKVSEAIKKFIGREDLNNSINVDECVAFGAAVQGSIISPSPVSKAKDLLLLDVIPLSLGLETHGNGFHVLIPRNSQVPTEKSGTFTTVVDNQDNVEIKIFQGERQLASENKLVKSFVFKITPNTKRGVPQIEVKYILDANGILTVTATEDKNTISATVTIGAIDKDEIKTIINNAAKFEAADKKKLEITQLTNNVREIQSNKQDIVKEIEKKKEEISDEQKSNLEKLSKKLNEKINENNKKLLNEVPKKDLEKISKNIQENILQQLVQIRKEIKKPDNKDKSKNESKPNTQVIDDEIIEKIKRDAKKKHAKESSKNKESSETKSQ